MLPDFFPCSLKFFDNCFHELSPPSLSGLYHGGTSPIRSPHYSPLTTHHSLSLQQLPPRLLIPPPTGRISRIADEGRDVVPAWVAPAPAGLYDLPSWRAAERIDLDVFVELFGRHGIVILGA